MSETQHGSFTFADFRLQSGEVMPEVTIAYCTRGRLAPDGRNAVLVTHGYTSGHRMINPAPVRRKVHGARWSVPARRSIPTGASSCARTCWGPAMDPPMRRHAIRAAAGRTGQFPHITVTDIVTAQHRLLEHLGVRHLRAVVGLRTAGSRRSSGR